MLKTLLCIVGFIQISTGSPVLGNEVSAIKSGFQSRFIPPEYVRHGNSFYKYHKTGTTFSNAVLICEGENAHLAIANSYNEALYLGDFVKNHEKETGRKINYVFIGFHDYFKEGQYTTIEGQSLFNTGYVNWQPGQPDNYQGNENCGSITRDGLLNDLNCFQRVPFICEIENTFC